MGTVPTRALDTGFAYPSASPSDARLAHAHNESRWLGNSAHANGADGGSPAGLYDMDVVVNPDTSITCAALPEFDKDTPMQGTKAARVCQALDISTCTCLASTLSPCVCHRLTLGRSRCSSCSPACATTCVRSTT